MWTGIVLMELFAIGHFFGFLAGRRVFREDPRFAEVTQILRSKTQRLLGLEASLLDLREYFSLNFSILLSLLVLMMLMGWLRSPEPLAATRTYSLLGMAAMATLLTTSIVYRVAQGVVSSAAIIAAFTIACVLSAAPETTRAPGATPASQSTKRAVTK